MKETNKTPTESQGLFPIYDCEEEISENGKKVRRKGVYLLPNLFTTGALFCGFYAIVNGMNHNFIAAAVAIFIAMIFDSLDGRVARMTGSQSTFGAEYDSLSDMVSFGVAPALVSYSWILHGLGKIGWLIAFFYAACTALRLARFNATHDAMDNRYFKGLPCPSAAAILAGLVWSFAPPKGLVYHFWTLHVLVALLIIAVGFLMLCNIRYYSFKDFDIKDRVPFVMLLMIVLIFAVVSLDPPRLLLSIFLCYVASGPIMAMLGRKTNKGASS